MSRRLYRSRNNTVISGVCGGIAEYFDVDPTLIRLAWALGSIFLGAGIGGLIAYVIAALIIPVVE